MKRGFLMLFSLCFLLSMASCRAAELPAAGSGKPLNSSSPTLRSQPVSLPSDAPATCAEEEVDRMYLQIGDTVWTATLESNPSVTAWKALLAQEPLTVDMNDYGGFEKVGRIGTTLTQSNRQITTRPGDIILYQGSSVTIYYGENSWNFTLLGHIDGVTDDALRQVLKAGGENVRVTFSLEKPEGNGGAVQSRDRE